MRPAAKTTTPPRYPFPSRPPWPPEHGAWFALSINFLLGTILSPFKNGVAEVVLAAAVLAFFLARHPLLLIAMRWKYRHLQPHYFFRERLVWVAAWGVLGVAGVAVLLLKFQAGFLAPVAVVWIASVIFELWAVSARMQKTALSEGWGMAALTLSVVASYSIGGASIPTAAWLLWTLTLVYHLQAVFYVRMRIRALSGKFSFTTWRDKIFFGRANIGMLILIWTVLAATASRGWIPMIVTAVFIPMTARALWGLTRLGGPTVVRRLGYSEVAYSLVFSGLVTYTFGSLV